MARSVGNERSGEGGSYEMFGARGGKFSSARPKTDVDWAIYRAKQGPGPGEYKPDASYRVSGGKFNMSKAKTEVEWIEHRASKLPGPGDYTLEDQTTSLIGGKFSTAKPKSSLDWTIYKSKQEPGPGQYDIDAHRQIRGGRFSTAKPKSDVDILIKLAKESPGPGQYSLDSKTFQMSGGKFNLSKPKSDVDWAIIRSGQIPGPQDYNADSSYRIGGGKFSNAKPKSSLDQAIFNGRLQPGPGEYNPEISSIGNRTGRKKNLPSAPSNTTPSRPQSAAIPPEARGKVKPRGEGNVSINKSYEETPKRPKRPVTSPGVREDPAARHRGSGLVGNTSADRGGGVGGGGEQPAGENRASSAPPVRVPHRPQTSRLAAAPSPSGGERKEVHSAKGVRGDGGGDSNRPAAVHRGVTPRSDAPRRRPVSALGITESSGERSRVVGSGGMTTTGRPMGGTLPARPHSSMARPSSRIPSSRGRRPQPHTHSISIQASEEEMSNVSEGDVIIPRSGSFVSSSSSSGGGSRRRSSTSRARSRSTDRGLGGDGERREHPLSSTMPGNVGRAHMRVAPKRANSRLSKTGGGGESKGSRNPRANLSDNAKKLFDLAMQSPEFGAMMHMYTGVRDPTEIIEKYAGMWSYAPLFDKARR